MRFKNRTRLIKIRMVILQLEMELNRKGKRWFLQGWKCPVLHCYSDNTCKNHQLNTCGLGCALYCIYITPQYKRNPERRGEGGRAEKGSVSVKTKPKPALSWGQEPKVSTAPKASASTELTGGRWKGSQKLRGVPMRLGQL